jgi:peptidoglycan/LPS O-acetylase OafA/YrhL
MTVWQFMRLRAIRLYPLFALGAALGLAGFWASGGQQHFLWRDLFNVFILPSPVLGGELFPLDSPAWSLFLNFGSPT